MDYETLFKNYFSGWWIFETQYSFNSKNEYFRLHVASIDILAVEISWTSVLETKALSYQRFCYKIVAISFVFS